MNNETITAIENAIEKSNLSKLFKNATGFTPEDIDEESTNDTWPLMFDVEKNELFILAHKNYRVASQQNPWVLCMGISPENIIAMSVGEIQDFVNNNLSK